MPQALLHPGVYIEEVPSGVRSITGVATSIALFIGWARKGPTDRALRLTSFADFERAYGGLDIDSLLGYAVRHFYDNGGSDAYVIRIVDDSGAGAAATAKATTGDLKVEASSPGEWGKNLEVSAVISGTRFRLDVRDKANNHAILESFVDLSLVPGDPRFAPAIINGASAYLANLSTTTVPPAAPVLPLASNVALTTGSDGTILRPSTVAAIGTFETKLIALFGTGAIADRLDLFNIICVPGLNHPATIGTMQGLAKANRAFLVVDCREDATVANVQPPPAGITGAAAENSALYFPWVLAPDPLQSGALRAFPPCGYVAGIFARTDSSRGVWKAPAGTEAGVGGATGLKINMSDSENGQLNPLGVNCLRTLPVYGNVVWGARTLHGNNDRGSEWKYIPIRRLALFLEESLYRGTQWVVFEPNDEPLWAQIRLNIGAFLNGLFRQGAFQGKTPREAYFVKCDRETTTQADINNGIVNIMVGFAPLKPAEFVVIKIQQMAGDIPT